MQSAVLGAASELQMVAPLAQHAAGLHCAPVVVSHNLLKGSPTSIAINTPSLYFTMLRGRHALYNEKMEKQRTRRRADSATVQEKSMLRCQVTEGATHISIAAEAEVRQLIAADLDALMAGLHMDQEVLGSGKLLGRPLFGGAEGADPEACTQVAVVPEEAQTMLQILSSCLPVLSHNVCRRHSSTEKSPRRTCRNSLMSLESQAAHSNFLEIALRHYVGSYSMCYTFAA